MFIKGDRVAILHNGEIVATGTIVSESAIVFQGWIVKHDVSRRNITLQLKDLRKIEKESDEE